MRWNGVTRRRSPPRSWPFLESIEPIGGPSVIWVGGERDDEPDMYVWLGEDRRAAPDPDVDFIAHARQDVPELLAAVRKLQATTR
jgi:hypothetical protein